MRTDRSLTVSRSIQWGRAVCPTPGCRPHPPMQTPRCEQNDWQTGVKLNLCKLRLRAVINSDKTWRNYQSGACTEIEIASCDGMNDLKKCVPRFNFPFCSLTLSDSEFSKENNICLYFIKCNKHILCIICDTRLLQVFHI